MGRYKIDGRLESKVLQEKRLSSLKDSAGNGINCPCPAGKQTMGHFSWQYG